MAKHFDTLNHQKIIIKLEHNSIRGKHYELLKSYLHNRIQTGEIVVIQSTDLTILTGVLQGTILGLLFS